MISSEIAFNTNAIVIVTLYDSNQIVVITRINVTYVLKLRHTIIIIFTKRWVLTHETFFVHKPIQKCE